MQGDVEWRVVGLDPGRTNTHGLRLFKEDDTGFALTFPSG